MRHVSLFSAFGLKIQQRLQACANTQATFSNTENILKMFAQYHCVMLPERGLFNSKNSKELFKENLDATTLVYRKVSYKNREL
jgi:hypothetical protein